MTLQGHLGPFRAALDTSGPLKTNQDCSGLLKTPQDSSGSFKKTYTPFGKIITIQESLECLENPSKLVRTAEDNSGLLRTLMTVHSRPLRIT